MLEKGGRVPIAIRDGNKIVVVMCIGWIKNVNSGKGNKINGKSGIVWVSTLGRPGRNSSLGVGKERRGCLNIEGGTKREQKRERSALCS